MKKLLFCLLIVVLVFTEQKSFAQSASEVEFETKNTTLPGTALYHLNLPMGLKELLTVFSMDLKAYEDWYKAQGVSIKIIDAAHGVKYFYDKISWVYDTTKNTVDVYYEAPDAEDKDNIAYQYAKSMNALKNAAFVGF